MPKPSVKSSPAPLRGRGRPSSKVAAELEEHILNVALNEFLQHGYGGSSLSNIISSAGISKTTLYSRFASKSELFSAVLQLQIDSLAPEAILPVKARSYSIEKGLTAYAEHMLRRSLQPDMMGINRLMQSEAARFPELGIAASDRTQRGIKRIAEFIEQCATADSLPCRNPESVAEVFIYMIRGWYMNILLTGRKVSPAARKKWIKQSIHVLLSSRDEW